MRPLLILARVSWASSSLFGEGVEEVPGATGGNWGERDASMNHRRTLESLFRLSLGTGCDPGAQRFLFSRGSQLLGGSKESATGVTSPGTLSFSGPPPPIRAPTANTREPLARASTRSTVHRKEWSNKRLLLDVKAASHNGSREIIASHRGQHHHHQRHDNVPFSLPWLRRRMWREGHGRTRRPGVCCVMQVQRDIPYAGPPLACHLDPCGSPPLQTTASWMLWALCWAW